MMHVIEDRTKVVEGLMDRMPTWAIIIDRDKLIHRANPTARQMGLVEAKRCYEAIGQGAPCLWCNTARCIDRRQVMTLTIRIEYTPDGAKRVERGGVRVDAHQIPLGPNRCLHFGSIGLLPEHARTDCLVAIGNLLGKVPLEVYRSIDRVVQEIPLNTISR
jgi:hypothetical protein